MFVQITQQIYTKLMPVTKKIIEKVGKDREIIAGNDFFRKIILEAKGDLPADWEERALKKFPDLNNPAGFTTLKNIYYGRNAADVQVILFLSDLAEVNKKNPLPSIH